MQLNETVPSVNKTPLLYFKDFYDSPKHWIGFEKDFEVGNRILKEFIPYVQKLHLLPKTVEHKS